MNLLRSLFSFLRRRKVDADMTEEMRLHLEQRTAENIAAGMSPDDARYAALRRFGGVEQAKELARERRPGLWLEHFAQDFRYALRACAKSPGFTLATVVTLALGIGVNTSLFSVVYGVLLDPYPYAKSSEIWAPDLRDVKNNRGVPLRYQHYHAMAQMPAVQSAMATSLGRATLSGGINPEILTAPRLSETGFEFLGVPPALGRGFSAADYQANGEPQPVTVISFKLWQRLFNGDREVLGRTLTLDDQPHTIIGVMPPRFGWYTNDGLWLPLPKTDLQRGVRPIVRLRPETTKAIADQQLLALAQNAAKENPGAFPAEGMKAAFINYLDVTVASGEMRSSLQLLFYAVGFLLLIACTNVANLQLARAAGRRREIALRLAMGATRQRLVRQLLTENLCLAVLGGAVGVFVAFGLTQVVVALMPDYYVPNEARVTMNGWVLTFSVAVSLVTGVLFGLAPALQTTKPDLNDALKSGSHGAGAAGNGNRTRNTLVVIEVALSVVLLVGAGLTIRGFADLQRTDRGFSSEQLLNISIPLSPKRYATLESRTAFTRDYVERLRALPGVRAVSAGSPIGFESNSGVAIPGQDKIPGNVSLNFVDADYLAAQDIPLRAGRTIAAQDVARGTRVAIITESAARLWTDGKDPIGRTLSLDTLVATNSTTLLPPNAAKEVTVIGIIPDVRSGDRREPARPGVLVPYTLRGTTGREFLVRAQVDPESLISAARGALRAMDPEQPMHQPLVLAELFRRMEAQPRFNLALFTSLAGVALALAAAGIYSVLSYVVAQRTREFGVRMALGAARSDILRLVLGTGGRLLGIGLAVGLVASVILAQWLKTQVFSVPLLDPLALAVAMALLALVALLACVLPARRASKVDPMIALRVE